MSAFIQWLHLTAAVVAVGGAGFLLLVLLPSGRLLHPEQRELLFRTVLVRFRWLSWGAIFLLLATGLYNVQLVWRVPWGTYWLFLTIKIILSLGLFAITLCLTLPMKALEWFRARRGTWLWVEFALANLIILLSAYLRRGSFP